jgi:hypothetical protein
MKDKLKAALRKKRYYQRHREELLRYAKNYRDTHKESIALKRKEYYINVRLKNPDKERAYHKKYNLKHKQEQQKKRKIYKELHKEEIKIGKLQHYYKLSKEEATLLYYKKLNGICDICGNPETSKYFLLSVDHNHKTGKVRGLLCSNCNNGLGRFKENIIILQNAIEYLKRRN